MVSDDPSVTARLQALEWLSERRSRREGIGRFGTAVMFVAICALLTSNVWLMLEINQSRDKNSDERLFWLLCHERSTSEARSHAFLELIKAGNVEWKSARLEKLKLSGADLAGVDVRFANLRDSDLSQANLREAELFRTSFELSDLTEADLSKSNLAESNFLKSRMNGANMREAVLVSSSMEQATAPNLNLILADMTESHLLMADLSGSNLTGANLTSADLEGAILRGTNLSLTRLIGANLKDTDFTDSNWWRAQGLNDEQLQTCLQKFAPTENAVPAYKKDFLLWVQTLSNE